MTGGNDDARLAQCLQRLKAGDTTAANDLLEYVYDRLRRLTRKMLKGFANVKRWEDTDDVLHNALLRFRRTLLKLAPSSIMDFERLAATHIRRTLLDLARHYYGPEGLGAHHSSGARSSDSKGATASAVAKPDSTYEPSRLAQWTELHRQVKNLPKDELEVFELRYYLGLSREAVADRLQISVRTVTRRWDAARLRLGRYLQG